MDGKKLAKALGVYRAALNKAFEDGEELPKIDIAFSVHDRKLLRKHLGDLMADLVEGIDDKVESFEEAQQDLDEALDILDALAVGAAAAQRLEELTEATRPPFVPVRVGDETAREGLSGDGAFDASGGGDG